MKLNRKWILVMSLVLSLAMATGSTLAYMTKKTDTLTNTFTLGNVDISLTEPSWNANNAVLYPGASVAKDPTIKNVGQGPAWVWMDVQIPTDVYPYITLETVDDDYWKVVKNQATGVITLMYTEKLAADSEVTPFTSVKLAENANLDNKTSFNISITGFAIQDSFDSIDKAYAAYYTPDIPTDMPDSLVVAIDTNNEDDLKGTITVKDADALLYLSTLNREWANKYSNGQGTDYSNYNTQNGGKGADYYYKWGWEVVLGADIDLENKNVQPIDLSGWGSFNGNGKTIKNAKITTDSNTQNDAGLFTGSVSYKDLTLENIHVTGSLVGNSTAGVLAGSTSKLVSGITIKNSSVWGGKYSGIVVGYNYGSITGCTVEDSTVLGGYKLGGIVGYICADSNKVSNVTSNSLKNCTVNGIGGDQYADGKTKYVVGKVVGNYNCNGTYKDNTITNMTTKATAEIGEIENGKTVTTQ